MVDELLTGVEAVVVRPLGDLAAFTCHLFEYQKVIDGVDRRHAFDVDHNPHLGRLQAILSLQVRFQSSLGVIPGAEVVEIAAVLLYPPAATVCKQGKIGGKAWAVSRFATAWSCRAAYTTIRASGVPKGVPPRVPHEKKGIGIAAKPLVFKAGPLGLEPRTTEPKSAVLPITPWASVNRTLFAIFYPFVNTHPQVRRAISLVISVEAISYFAYTCGQQPPSVTARQRPAQTT